MAKNETIEGMMRDVTLQANVHWAHPRLWRLRMVMATFLLWLVAWVLGVGGIGVTGRGAD